jgi:hypothetical protein
VWMWEWVHLHGKPALLLMRHTSQPTLQATDAHFECDTCRLIRCLCSVVDDKEIQSTGEGGGGLGEGSRISGLESQKKRILLRFRNY